MLTAGDLYAITPYVKRSRYDVGAIVNNLNGVFNLRTNPFTDISSVRRQSAFLSQCLYESSYFCRLSENLNYSAKGLITVFPKYFTLSTAKDYERNPEKIANKVYSNRLGNGSESSGDGWKYRGRGLIQVTGRWNYRKCSESLGINLVEKPEHLETEKGAVRSAYWYWTSNPSLNIYSDQNKIKEITRIVSGGSRGLAERERLFHKCIEVFSQ